MATSRQPGVNLLGLELQELTRLVEESAQPSYRARQLFQALYGNRISEIDQVSTIPVDFRSKLKEQGISVGSPEISNKFSSSDGTVRYLIRLGDGETVETVWMPEGDDGEFGDGSEAGTEGNRRNWDRATICVSSQFGCAVNCHFCLT